MAEPPHGQKPHDQISNVAVPTTRLLAFASANTRSIRARKFKNLK